jgi:predicted RNA methylase
MRAGLPTLLASDRHKDGRPADACPIARDAVAMPSARGSHVLDLLDGPGAVASNARALGAAPVLALARGEE